MRPRIRCLLIVIYSFGVSDFLLLTVAILKKPASMPRASEMRKAGQATTPSLP